MDLLPKLEADFLPDTPDDIDLDTESEEDNVPLPVPEPVKPIIPEEDIFVDTKKK